MSHPHLSFRKEYSMQAYWRGHGVAVTAVFASAQMGATAGGRLHHEARTGTNRLHSSVLLCSDFIAGSDGIVTHQS